jgi:hypothetical protein
MMNRSQVTYVLLPLLLLACISSAQTPLTYIPTGPCRVVDTRWQDGPFGGPSIAGGAVRTVTIPDNAACAIPNTATAYALNVTVVPQTIVGYITLWPTGQNQPFVSTLNSLDGRIKAVAAVVGAGPDTGINVYSTNTTDLVLDIVGYFVGPGNPNALYYYPLPNYCELFNTVNPPSPDGLGGPALQAGIARSFQVTNNQNCTIPANAAAYSLNVTATPMNGNSLGYVTVWPSDQAQPYTSTLNAPTGTTVANAAIVEAGTGAISVYADADTNVEVYLNGYFAPGNASSGNALYAFSPCRGNDTRPNDFTNRLDYILQTQGGCQATLPPQASRPAVQAFLLNATVVPEAGLGYFPIWPYGHHMPVPSTLFALDGAITSNMAIVPAGHNGEISAFASGATNVVYDVFGYFASSQLTILTQPPLPTGTRNVPYTPFTMQARGGVPPYTWSAVGLPANLTIDPATGTISGCPLTAANAPVAIGVSDSSHTPSPPHIDHMTLNPLPWLTIATTSLPSGTRYVPYSEQLTAAGGYGTYTWALSSGSLPPGFSLSTTGLITGYYTGQNPGTWHFTVKVTDQECQAPASPTQSLSIRIN